MKLAIALLCGTAAAFSFGRTSVRPVRTVVYNDEAEAAPEAVAEEAAPEPEVVAEVAEPAPAEEAPAVDDIAAREAAKTPLSELVVGNNYDGKVTGVANYGCFVDIGAASDGLVHISELSAGFVSDVTEVVSEGDAVSVRVLKIDEEKKQLSLSLKPEGAAKGPPRKKGGGGKKKAGADELRKYLEADPQEFIDGTVRTVLSWGAFVNIAEGVDGLVHISRVADGRVEDLEAELSPGDKVKVRVVEVDLEKATLALAMNTYRDNEMAPPPRRRDNDDGESAAAKRARNPDQKGGQARPKRRDPGDDLWDNTDSFDWKDVIETEVGDEDALASGFQVDVVTGQLTLQ